MKKIIALVLTVALSAGVARADVCAARLVPTFTAAQARVLCTVYGTSVAVTVVPQTNNTYDLGSASLTWRKIFVGTDLIHSDSTSGIITGEATRAANVTTATNAAVPLYISVPNAGNDNAAFIAGSAAASGPVIDFFKTRATSGAATTIVVSGDVAGKVNFFGANGTTYDPSARIIATIDGTPGATTDMPGALDFQTSPDGSATTASVLKLSADKSALFTGAVTSSATGSLGWSYVTGANTACTTTCTSAAVFGVDLAGGASAPVIVAASNAAADACVCAGAS